MDPNGKYTNGIAGLIKEQSNKLLDIENYLERMVLATEMIGTKISDLTSEMKSLRTEFLKAATHDGFIDSKSVEHMNKLYQKIVYMLCMIIGGLLVLFMGSKHLFPEFFK